MAAVGGPDHRGESEAAGLELQVSYFAQTLLSNAATLTQNTHRKFRDPPPSASRVRRGSVMHEVSCYCSGPPWMPNHLHCYRKCGVDLSGVPGYLQPPSLSRPRFMSVTSPAWP